jgi:DNA-binding transcriptional LysR family regulator
VLLRVLGESDALTFLPRFIVDRDVEEGRLAVIAEAAEAPSVRLGVAWLRGRSLGGAGTTFLELLRDARPPVAEG